jgi:hypothetical protein
MSHPRHPAFWPILVAFAGGCVWWMLYVPARPDQVLRALPPEATLVTAHRGLAARWNDLSSNPIALTLLGALGVDAKTAREMNEDAVFSGWLDRLASDEVAVAYVPRLGPSGDPAWVFATWLGGRSQQIRWQLNTGRIPGIRHVYDRAGDRVWMLDRRSFKIKPSSIVAFSIVEGMLVGTVAPMVAATAEVLDQMAGFPPSRVERSDALKGVRESSSPDRGWFAWQGGRGGALQRVEVEIPRLASAALEANIRGPWRLPEAGTNTARVPTRGLEQLLGDAPIAYAMVDRNLAGYWLARIPSAAWRDMAGLHATLGEGPLFVGLLGGEYSGRLKGIKLPTLTVGSAVKDEDAAIAALQRHLDDLNARWNWGLVPNAVDSDFGRLLAVEGTAATWYSGLADRERVACLVSNGWVLFSSNTEALTNLLAHARGGNRSWVGDAAIHGEINLEEGGKTLRLAIAAWSLKLAMEDPDGSRPLRQKLNEAKAWMDTLAPLKRLRFSVRQAPEGTLINLKAGGDS